MKTKLAIFLLTAFFTFSCKKSSVKTDFKAVGPLVERIFQNQSGNFEIDSIASENGKEVFELQTINGKVKIGASSPTAAGYALNFYLTRYCHCQWARSGVNLNIPEKLPEVVEKIRMQTPFENRYFFNYCTFNYTMSFWEWPQWEKEIDWMALHGINMPLAIIGTEKVWQNTLKKFGFSDQEISDFIPGPAYTAWWLMGNLEGWGGPVSQQWIDSRAELQQKILARMREYGIKPVLQGFYGMVPNLLAKKFPGHKIIEQGYWGGDNQGFIRPAILDPSDSLFAQMAKVFYEETEKLYGKVPFYGGDPFHEGGNIKGVDVTAGAKNIQKAMLDANPASTWVLQGWWENPRDILLQGCDKKHTLIIDLFAETEPQWLNRKGYAGFPFIWCAITNFGSKVGLYGKLDTLAKAPYHALNSPYGNQLKGLGLIMEGAETNPVNYELSFDAAWSGKPINIESWIKTYLTSRYGKKDENALEAWNIMLKTVYSAPAKRGDLSEDIIFARPALNLNKVAYWSPAGIYYDTLLLEKAAVKLASASENIADNDAYAYDMVDVTRQVLANKGRTIYFDLVKSIKEKNKEKFSENAQALRNLLLDMDTLLSTRKEFMLGQWIKSARDMAKTPQEKDLFEENARMLITIWGNEGTAVWLHDYSFREWSGMISSFYLGRWELFFDQMQNQLNGKPAKETNYYEWEKNWTKQTNPFPVEPKKDAVKASKIMLTKYKIL